MSHFKELFGLIFSIFLLCLSIFFVEHRIQSTSTDAVSSSDKQFTVIIDSGHGGFDSGKVGVDNTLEKDLNLIMAKKLQTLLEAEDIQVVMVREDDRGLYQESSHNKKVEDLKSRISLINDTAPDCVISIHQNSYHEESIHGAQVFYYTTSDNSRELAELLQSSLISRVDPANHRQAKANDSYYLLKKTEYPIVIVECGFLSNLEESKKLVDDSYQQKLVWAIHMGVLQWLNSHTSK